MEWVIPKTAAFVLGWWKQSSSGCEEAQMERKFPPPSPECIAVRRNGKAGQESQGGEREKECSRGVVIAESAQTCEII